MQEMTASTSLASVYYFMSHKRCPCFLLLLLLLTLGSFSTLGFLLPQIRNGGERFLKTTITPTQRSFSFLICNSVDRNKDDDDKSEEPGDTDSASGNSNTSNDDDGGGDDDIVEVPPVPIRRDDLFLPRQLPVDVFHSVEEKRRRRHERSLLQQLEEGDEAVKELRLFWRSQLGSSREEDLLRKAATGIGDPSAWKESQDILEELCKEHPTFLHAFALLSKLYCLMGRLEDSQTMALEVLKLKPWHFLAIETMVATSYALNQINTSVYWASRRMPPPSRTEKRREWVDRALKDSLDYENGLTSFEQTIPGEQTEDTDYGCNNDSFRNEDTDSWQ